MDPAFLRMNPAFIVCLYMGKGDALYIGNYRGRPKANQTEQAIRSKRSITPTSSSLSTVILFGILGSYLFLHLWEIYIIKIVKISTKIHAIGKIKAIFGLEMTPIYKAIKMAK